MNHAMTFFEYILNTKILLKQKSLTMLFNQSVYQRLQVLQRFLPAHAVRSLDGELVVRFIMASYNGILLI